MSNFLLSEEERVRFYDYLLQDAKSNELLSQQLKEISSTLAKRKHVLSLAQELVAKNLIDCESQSI